MKNDFEIASPLVLLKDDALFITKLTRKLTTGNNYGYAATAHSSQGATVDRVMVDIDTKSRSTNDAAYYVEISRARFEAKIYTNDRTKLPEAVQRNSEKSAALDVAYSKENQTQLRQNVIRQKHITGLDVERGR